MYFSALERAAWPRIVPFAIYMGFIVLADGLTLLGWPVLEQRWLYGVKIGAVLLALWCWRRAYSELQAGVPSAGAVLEAVVVGLLVLYLWINLDADWMVIGQPAGFDPRHDGVIVWPLVVLRIAGAALVVPLMEELFWRSFLLRCGASCVAGRRRGRPGLRLAVRPQWQPVVARHRACCDQRRPWGVDYLYR